MDYSVGSLAELISGKKTPNKTKLIQKSFTPIKKELPEPAVESETTERKSFKTPKKVSPKKKRGSVKKEPVETNVNGYSKVKSPKPAKFKFPKRKSGNSHELSVNDGEKREKSPLKSKSKKRNLDESTDLLDSDAEQATPKKEKLSENEKNAASRIKNKINQENKNSIEYKERTVFVGNIPISIKKEKIKKHFRKYGLIETVRIRGIPVADPKTSKKVAAINNEFHPDRNTLYAFIRFQNSEDAKRAEAENGQLFFEHHLRVHCCESNDEPDESKGIFVGNLSFKAEEEELWNLFKSCGPISHVRIVRDGRTGMGKGFGYVNFKDTDAVQLALEMENVVLKDRELRISLCDANRAKKKKLGKKPRNRTRMFKSKDRENADGTIAREKKFSKHKAENKDAFSGTKFNDIKKKKKFSKATLEKKKLAKQLVAPISQKS